MPRVAVGRPAAHGVGGGFDVPPTRRPFLGESALIPASKRIRGQSRRWIARLRLGRTGTRCSAGSPLLWIVSGLMVTLFVGLGWSALPSAIALAPGAMRLRDELAGQAPIAAPVFVLHEDGSALRFGVAALEAPGVIRVGLYDTFQPRFPDAMIALSLPGDGRLLWLLASPDERRALREQADALALGVSWAVTEILRSDAFAADYRDPLWALLRSDARSAWDSLRESPAWRDLAHRYQTVLRQTAIHDLQPIMERQLQGIVPRMLRANALRLVDPFHDRTWDLDPIEDDLKEMLREVQERGLIEQTSLQLLQTPQTLAFLKQFVDVVGTTLAHDTDLIALVGRMTEDLRFRPYTEAATTPLFNLGRTGARLLVSPRADSKLNLVAATAIHTAVAAQFERVVVFVNPRQRDELRALDPSAVHLLRPLDPAGL